MSTEGRFILREGSRGGERILASYDDPRDLLRLRDEFAERHSPRSFRFDVIDTEATDPPESGEVEWCEICKATPVLASQEECLHCQGLPALEGEDLNLKRGGTR